MEIGGTLKRVPVIYPRPGAYPDETPTLDWSVMQDPFGNEFCVISLLTPEESMAAVHAAEEQGARDQALREAVGRA